MNLKFETIVQIFRKIIQLNAFIVLKRTNEYYQKIISKSVFKMDLYPAMSILRSDEIFLVILYLTDTGWMRLILSH